MDLPCSAVGKSSSAIGKSCSRPVVSSHSKFPGIPNAMCTSSPLETVGFSMRSRTLQLGSALGSPRTYDALAVYLARNKDTVLELISYSSVFVCELIRNWPKLEHIVQRLLYRLRLVKSLPKDPAPLTPKQEYLAGVFNSIYGYIVDIRIAENIFGIFPYVSEFLSNYSSWKKIRSVDSWEKLDKFASFFLFGNYTWLENLGFLTSHGFVPDSFNYFVLPWHKTGTGISTSDWYYVYSCQLWFLWNLIANVKSLKSGLDFNLLCNLVLSYHWALPQGFLDRPSFAMIGFLNAVTKVKKTLK